MSGIFSLVIYDLHSKNIFVARDALGVKPLYFFKDNNILIFSSEIKSFSDFVENNVDHVSYNIIDINGEGIGKEYVNNLMLKNRNAFWRR